MCVTQFKGTQDRHPVCGGRHASGCWLVHGGRQEVMFVVVFNCCALMHDG